MDLPFKLAHGASIVAECDELRFLAFTCDFDNFLAILSHWPLRHDHCYVNSCLRASRRINSRIGEI